MTEAPDPCRIQYISDQTKPGDNMSKVVHLHDKRSKALLPQKKIDLHDFPFTLNTAIGCLYGCKYCYLQNAPFKWHSDFGNEVKIKIWIPDQLDKELEKHQGLPQHLKRVQVNAATEGYLPQAINKVEDELGRDIMKEVLAVFKKHWDNGNRWMVHLVTKSHMVRRHLSEIEQMKDQDQLEVTLTTLDEARARMLEGTAPSVQKRLEIIKEFSGAGVFVRVMCMPFIGDEAAARDLRDRCFALGAKAFKHKGMNYWDETAILQGNLVAKGGKEDLAYDQLLVKSGEPVLDDKGQPRTRKVSMPDSKWREYSDQDMIIVDSGYSEINDINWGYII